MKRSVGETESGRLLETGWKTHLRRALLEHQIIVPTPFPMSQRVGDNYKRYILGIHILKRGWCEGFSTSVSGDQMGAVQWVLVIVVILSNAFYWL